MISKLQEFQMFNWNPLSTPMQVGIKINKNDYPNISIILQELYDG
jgi:hypothetical protein